MTQMGWPTGIEPATTSATNWRSTNWTTVTIISFFGAGNEVRTRDIQLGRLTLYQLSYSRTLMVGIARFELAAPCSQGRCATGLRYIPTYILIPRYYSPFFLFCQAIFYTFTIKSNSFKVFSNSSTFSFETFFVFSLMNSKYFSTFSLSFNTI